MSQRWMNLVRDAGPEHPETCSLVRALADYANDYGVSWPSIPTLATYLRASERTVYRRIALAREEGWITVRSGGGRRKSNTYTLVEGRFSRLVGNPDRNGDRNPDRNPDVGVTVSRETLTPVTKNPDTRVTQPPRPPSKASSTADDQLAVLVGVEVVDDDELRESLHGLTGVLGNRTVRELVGVALGERGHTATTVNRYLRDRMAGNPSNPMGCLIAALREIPAHVAPAPPAPPCQECHGSGWVDATADVLERCPACHPPTGERRASGAANGKRTDSGPTRAFAPRGLVDPFKSRRKSS